MEIIVLQKFLVAIGIGALIGIEREREKYKHEDTGSGFRTFILIALLGAISAFLMEYMEMSIAFGVIFVSFAALIVLSYYFFAKKDNLGVITEISSLLVFILGFIAMTEYTSLAVILAAVIVILIESKKVTHEFIKNTSHDEWMDTLKFATIAFIIYPILPNEAIDPWGLINPSKIWLLVVLISAVEFIGYFLIKTIGSKRGVVLNGFLGGVVSSTAVTLSMTNQSMKFKKLTPSLVLATTIASLTMFVRVGVLVGLLSEGLILYMILAILPAFLVMIGLGLYFTRSVFTSDEHKTSDNLDLSFTSPFKFKPAIKMALLFTAIKVISEVALMVLGNSGVYLTSLFSGIVDVDAITVSVMSLFNQNEIVPIVAVQAVLIAIIMNTLFKGTMAKLNGSKEFGNQIAIIFGGTFLMGLITLIYLLFAGMNF